jgi:hypothetical protein
MTGNASERTYCSYLVRFWRTDTRDPCWRASLEDPRTGARTGFASLEQLFAFLLEQVEGAGKGVKME